MDRPEHPNCRHTFVAEAMYAARSDVMAHEEVDELAGVRPDISAWERAGWIAFAPDEPYPEWALR